MELDSETKQRPLRIYETGNNFYIYNGAKKIKVNTDLEGGKKRKRSAVQKQYLSKLKGNMKPKSRIAKQERARFKYTSAEGFERGSPVTVDTTSEERFYLSLDPEDSRYSEYLEKIAKKGNKLTQEQKNILDLTRDDNKLEQKLRDEHELDDELEQKLRDALDIAAEKIEEEEKKLREEKLLAPARRRTNYEIKRDEEKLERELSNIRDEQKQLDTLKEAQERRSLLVDTELKKHGFSILDLRHIKDWNGLKHGNNVYIGMLISFITKLANMPEQQLKNYIKPDKGPFFTDEKDTKKKILKRVFGILTPGKYNAFRNNNDLSLPLIPIRDVRLLGTGKKLPALYNDEIEDFFDDANKYPHFGGVIASDQISSLPKKLPIGFIMNTDKSSGPGEHWVAVYISGDSVEYFDPLAEPPTKDFITDVKKYLESMKVPVLMKFKINKVKQQDSRTNHCGFFAIKFLDDRFAGIPYPWTTRYVNNAKKGENIVQKEFSYI